MMQNFQTGGYPDCLLKIRGTNLYEIFPVHYLFSNIVSSKLQTTKDSETSLINMSSDSISSTAISID